MSRHRWAPDRFGLSCDTCGLPQVHPVHGSSSVVDDPIVRRLSDSDLDEISKLSGGDRAHATRVAKHVLSNSRGASSPLLYILAAVRNNLDAYRYQRGNPRTAKDWCPQPGHEGEWADTCRACTLDRRLAGGTP